VQLRGRIRRGVRVRRVIRRVELWSVAKIALFLHAFCGLISLGVVTGLWTIARRVGLLDRVAKLLGQLLATRNFVIHGDVLFRGLLITVGVLVIFNTLATVILAFLYNMLSSILGGAVFSVLQEVPRPGTVAAELQAQALGMKPEPTRRERRAREREAKLAEKARFEQAKQPQVSVKSRKAKVTKVGASPSDRAPASGGASGDTGYWGDDTNSSNGVGNTGGATSSLPVGNGLATGQLPGDLEWGDDDTDAATDSWMRTPNG
jgi:Transmembrane domain of unknown function (DUF3566)